MSKGSRNRKGKTKKPESAIDLVITKEGARFNEQYQMIADAAGLGWLHLPSQDQFEKMQMEAFKRGMNRSPLGHDGPGKKDETE